MGQYDDQPNAICKLRLLKYLMLQPHGQHHSGQAMATLLTQATLCTKTAGFSKLTNTLQLDYKSLQLER